MSHISPFNSASIIFVFSSANSLCTSSAAEIPASPDRICRINFEYSLTPSSVSRARFKASRPFSSPRSKVHGSSFFPRENLFGVLFSSSSNGGRVAVHLEQSQELFRIVQSCERSFEAKSRNSARSRCSSIGLRMRFCIAFRWCGLKRRM